MAQPEHPADVTTADTARTAHGSDPLPEAWEVADVPAASSAIRRNPLRTDADLG
ncbi:hypothetical protein [Actinomadura parmotrematis]|uniref:Uncharacterized protein n=1 Tax=Actinomadura parmotrematis TaxID=2864039 RepID=A0ABS7FZW1_9ACTN|nr:hypothetical protein [Actinomadura parmotrematis]MBW8485680.1 hypothetical protein [Actinomadura parmotrematis]